MDMYSRGLGTDTEATCQQDLDNLCEIFVFGTFMNLQLQFHTFVVWLLRPVDGWRPGFVWNMTVRVTCTALTKMAFRNGSGFSPLTTAVDPLFPEEARWWMGTFWAEFPRNLSGLTQSSYSDFHPQKTDNLSQEITFSFGIRVEFGNPKVVPSQTIKIAEEIPGSSVGGLKASGPAFRIHRIIIHRCWMTRRLGIFHFCSDMAEGFRDMIWGKQRHVFFSWYSLGMDGMGGYCRILETSVYVSHIICINPGG